MNPGSIFVTKRQAAKATVTIATQVKARGSARVSLVLGLVILAVFIPIHVMLWHSFPVWYDLTVSVPRAVDDHRIAIGAIRRAAGSDKPASLSIGRD